MKEPTLVEYIAYNRKGKGSGYQVLLDGTVLLHDKPAAPKQFARLDEAQIQELKGEILCSGLLEFPEVLPAPPGLKDAAPCDWSANVDGKKIQVRVIGWSDLNPKAIPLRKLATSIYKLAAQAISRDEK